MPRPPAAPAEDIDRLRVHAAYCRRIGRHTLAEAIDHAATAVELTADVVDAWNVAGPRPDVHQRAKDVLVEQWPTLANAVRRLASIRR